MERENNNSYTPPPMPPNKNSAHIVGTIIILVGLALLFKNLNFGYLFPDWLFSWEIILIIIGLVIGVNSKFEKKSSIILIAIGVIFILKDIMHIPFGKVMLPLIAVGIGVFLIMRNKRSSYPNVPPFPPTAPEPGNEYDWDKRVKETDEQYTKSKPTDPHNPFARHTNDEQNEPSAANSNPNGNGNSNAYNHSENYLKVDSILGNARKIMLTKNFLGGNITNVFGSTEINLLQADLQQPVVLDIFQLFGSTKIIVPPHWNVNTNLSSILSENDDRRVIITHLTDKNKVLYITGSSIFGNLTIKN